MAALSEATVPTPPNDAEPWNLVKMLTRPVSTPSNACTGSGGAVSRDVRAPVLGQSRSLLLRMDDG